MRLTGNNLKKIMLLFCLIPLFKDGNAQAIRKTTAQEVIRQSRNPAELSKAYNHYKSNGKDSLKFKAMDFLIRNMDAHYSESYYWADSIGRKVPFDELSYSSFLESTQAFGALKKKHGQLKPVKITYRDIDTITALYLVDNLEQAFSAWNKINLNKPDFNTFCEYILPYRVHTEPLQNWRSVYTHKFSWLADSVKNEQSPNMVSFLIKDFNRWFTSMYNFEKRKEPLPYLGALQILHRKKGFCEDVAALAAFSLRATGIAASTDIVPYWATSSGSHMLNYARNNTSNDYLHFDVLFKDGRVKRLIREPGKVLRYRYSKNPASLPFITDTANIPTGVLQKSNITDVTKEYWPVEDFRAFLTAKPTNQTGNIVYACVLNYLHWSAVWWAPVKPGTDSVSFTDMGKGVVYLPMYFSGKKFTPAGYPVALGYNNKAVLKPDFTALRSIQIQEQEGYLRFQKGTKYRLFYWDHKWQPAGELTHDGSAKQLTFTKVPDNALLLLLPDKPKQKERPFIITKEGRRVWF